MLKIAHIINPVKVVEPSSDLFLAQPVTFETMKVAKESARSQVEVELYSAQFPEDREIIPDIFHVTRDLERSVLDVRAFQVDRKLPLVQDILDRLYESSQAEYFIYSNVDIALLPQFYFVVCNMINKGYDAFVINRRTISKDFSGVEDLALMYASVGEKHPGYDCFVFRRDVYQAYRFGTACVGANWIGRVLIANLMCYASQFKVFDDLHLTFHIGNEQNWKNPAYREYDRHNEEELYQILLDLKKKGSLEDKPLIEKFLEQIEHKRKLFAYYADGQLSQNPIFVVGYPRSGTTLLQALIATQDNIYTFPETHFFCHYLYPLLKMTESGSIEKASLEQFFLRTKDLLRLHLRYYEQQYLKDLADSRQLFPKQLFEYLVRRYLSDQGTPADLSTVRWLEKTPSHALVIEHIYSLYPDAQFVAIIRNPLAAILSRKKSVSKEYSFKYLAVQWKATINILDEFRQRYPDTLMIVKYEELIQEPVHIMSAVCAFLHIRFDEKNMQNFSEISKTFIRPFERWKRQLRGSTILKATNNKYMQELALTDILKIQNIVKEAMKQHHYKVHYPAYQMLYDWLVHVKPASYELGRRYEESL